MAAAPACPIQKRRQPEPTLLPCPAALPVAASPACPLQLQGYLHQNGQNRMRSRTYRVGSHVRYGFTFAPAVRPPLESRWVLLRLCICQLSS